MDLYLRSNPVAKIVPVVATVPHSGLYVPASIEALFEAQHRGWLRNTDWFLPQLYSFLPELGVTMLVATQP